MKVSLTTLAPHDRIWIYASPKPFTADQIHILENTLDHFVKTWSSHQIDLEAGYEIVHQHFIIIGVKGENKEASGCSIDKSVRVMQDISEQLGVDLLSRANLYFWMNEEVKVVPLASVKNEIENHRVTEETLFFDTTLVQKEDFDKFWPAKSKDRWLKRYFFKVLN
ncbi:MAG: hypothetical protein U0U66_10315 [Cytophagaceae bacterium]